MTASFLNWDWVPSPHFRAGRRSDVTGIVQHYTAGGNGRSLARWLAGPDAKVSAHILICRDGHVIQQVKLDCEAWHAGEKQSAGLWRGAPQPENVNRFTVGIENSNYGWVIRDDSGKFWLKRKTKQGFKQWRPYVGPHPIQSKDHKGVLRYWEPYTDTLITANIEAMKRIIELYPAVSRENVEHHSSISPDRKFDPGPLWPAAYVLDEVFGRGEAGIHTVAPNVVLGGPGDPIASDGENALQGLRDFYDEDTEMCIDPAAEQT